MYKQENPFPKWGACICAGIFWYAMRRYVIQWNGRCVECRKGGQIKEENLHRQYIKAGLQIGD